MRKTLLCSVICVIILFCGGIRVDAAVNTISGDCGENHTHTIYTHEFRGYGGHTSTYHVMNWYVEKKCDKCGHEFKGIETEYVSHSFLRDRYDDLGHMEGSHMYRLHCACGYGESRTIPCNGTNGNHNTPW